MTCYYGPSTLNWTTSLKRSIVKNKKVGGYHAPITTIHTQTINSKDMTGSEVDILDVCNGDEWNKGHLAEAIHIPHGKLLMQDLPFDKKDKIYVHCQSGVRSSIAVGILEYKGFKNIVNVKEGYQAFPETLK